MSAAGACRHTLTQVNYNADSTIFKEDISHVSQIFPLRKNGTDNLQAVLQFLLPLCYTMSRSKPEGGNRMARAKGIKPMAQNRKAFHDYFVEERIECGMELHGTEVKSMRQGRMNLKESFAVVKDGEVLVCGMHISPYEQGNIFNTDPLRQKKLLLHKSEIRHLAQEAGKMGYSLIPLQVYLKDGRFKMELGLCKGKKLHDKRESMAERDTKREMQRALRTNNRGE